MPPDTDGVELQPGTGEALRKLEVGVSRCRACPRLVQWREQVAQDKRRSFESEEYWGRPVPGYGDPAARVLIVGLAPAAHGGNRTGRIFTGDRSGDFLFGSLYRTGFATQPESLRRGDGLRLIDMWVGAVVRCAPPDNKPLPEERDRCLPYLATELRLLENLKVIVALGGFAWDGALRALRDVDVDVPKPRPRFGHAAEAEIGRYTLIGCFHPSQQNTFTGRLTEAMIDDVFRSARSLLR